MGTARVLAVGSILTLVSAGLIFVHDFFVQSPQFCVRDIQVTGNRRLSQATVLTIAGIDSQTNILALNLTTARKRLLAEPWIADATVSRKIPSGITIAIREEHPLARLEMGDGQAFLFNLDGRVFKRAVGTDGARLPRIQGLCPADLPVHGKPDSEVFRSVMTLLRMAREKDSPLAYPGLRRIQMDREIGATAHMGENDRAVKLGFGLYREKCAALRYLMARMKRDRRLARSQVIDLYDVNRIVITLAPAGDPGSDREEV